jgi:hypothetical protein
MNNSSIGINASGLLSLEVHNSAFLGNPTIAQLNFSDGLDFSHTNNTASGGTVLGYSMRGTPDHNQTWTKDTIPYVVSSTLTIPVGVTLTLEPGVVVKVGDSQHIYIYGTLDAQGTTAMPIYFTSVHDDEIGGDTNGDGAATSPGTATSTANRWANIQLLSGSVVNLGHVIARYGGYGSPYANIYNTFGDLAFTNSTSTLAYQSGISHSSGTSTITDSVLNDNQYGLQATSAGGTIEVASSTIMNNSSIGINASGLLSLEVHNSAFYNNNMKALSNSTAITLNAENNWWGDESGPYNATSNPSGLGDEVSNYVDFDPWLDAEPGSNPIASSSPQDFYAQIKNTGAGVWSLRDGAGTSTDVLKELPEDWVVYVASTTDAFGDPVTANGYHWYKVTDKTDDVSGWMAGESADGTTVYLPYNDSKQAEFEITASSSIAYSERQGLIIDAIDHYYNNASSTYSLYSSDDGSIDLSNLKNEGFEKKVIWGMSSWESGGSLNNEIVTYDYGHGIMQITPYELYSNESITDGWQYNEGDNRGIASRIKIIPCTSNESPLYMNCYINGGEHDGSVKGYKHYGDDPAAPIYKYYTNTPQSIYANIKDGLYILNQKLELYDDISTSTTTLGETFTATDRKTILTTAAYYGADHCEYVGHIADRLDDINTYFPDTSATTSDIADLRRKMHVASDNSLCVQLHSPGDLSVQDSSGRTVGVVNGKGVNDFPLAIYSKDEKYVEILASDDDDYTYRVDGTGKGVYGLDITVKRGGKSLMFKARNIPIVPHEVHTYSIDKAALLKGQEGVTIKIDSDGNGVVEKTIKVGLNLDKSTYLTKLKSQEIPIDNIDKQDVASTTTSPTLFSDETLIPTLHTDNQVATSTSEIIDSIGDMTQTTTTDQVTEAATSSTSTSSNSFSVISSYKNLLSSKDINSIPQRLTATFSVVFNRFINLRNV